MTALSSATGLRIMETKLLECGGGEFIVSRGVLKIIPLLPFHVTVTNVSNQSDHLPQEMMTTHGTEPKTLTAQRTKPSAPMAEGGEGDIAF